MTTPANHFCIITLPNSIRMKGAVIAVKKIGPGGATLTIETPDVLPPGEYQAIYATPSQEAEGTFKVFSMAVTNHYRWRATGIFTRAKQRRW